MKFWTEEKIKEAICDCTLHNFPENWNSNGLRIWHTDFDYESMALVRTGEEKRGIIPEKLPEILDKVSAIITTNPALFTQYGKPIVELEVESGDAILMFAKYIRKFFKGKVIDITGSSGKSTTTSMVYDILKYKGASANLGKANTSWGIAWNMTNFNIEDSYWVIETSLGGGIARNSKITQPDYAMITNIAPVHLRDNQDLSDIAREKSKIFTAMQEGAYAILYKQMAHFDIIEKAAKDKKLNIITYGTKDSNINIVCGKENAFEIFGKTYKLNNTPTPEHIMLDMAAALGIAYIEQLDLKEAIDKLKTFQSLAGRGEAFSGSIAPNKTVNVVDEAYNANPLSMKSALEGFKKVTGGENAVLIIGDMSEGGADTKKQHLELEKTIREIKPSRILLCGQEIKALWNVLKFDFPGAYYENVELLNKELVSWLKNGDNIFVKASHSIGLYKTINVLKAYMKKYNKEG